MNNESELYEYVCEEGGGGRWVPKIRRCEYCGDTLADCLPGVKVCPSHFNSAKFTKEYSKERGRKSHTRLLIEKLGAACYPCQSTSNLEIDHIIALSLGGADEYDNLQVLCAECHQRKTSADMRQLNKTLKSERRSDGQKRRYKSAPKK